MNKGDLCGRIAHPMACYARRLDDADDDEEDLEDWRDREADAEEA